MKLQKATIISTSVLKNNLCGMSALFYCPLLTTNIR